VFNVVVRWRRHVANILRGFDVFISISGNTKSMLLRIGGLWAHFRVLYGGWVKIFSSGSFLLGSTALWLFLIVRL